MKFSHTSPSNVLEPMYSRKLQSPTPTISGTNIYEVPHCQVWCAISISSGQPLGDLLYPTSYGCNSRTINVLSGADLVSLCVLMASTVRLLDLFTLIRKPTLIALVFRRFTADRGDLVLTSATLASTIPHEGRGFITPKVACFRFDL